MFLYRIAKESYIRDLSGSGPRLYGGRWNPKGVSVIYTSENRALAVLELFVHMSRTIIPPNLSLATIEVPDTASKKEMTVKDLVTQYIQKLGENIQVKRFVRFEI